MERITNKHILEHLKTLQTTITKNENTIKEQNQKIETILQKLQDLQNKTTDKHTLYKLLKQTQKSMMITYLALSLAYLGIGAIILFSSLQLRSFEYSIIFGVFLTGSIILAALAYLKKKEVSP
jgi:hypothetical protein